jgi:hypothetical protein
MLYIKPIKKRDHYSIVFFFKIIYSSLLHPISEVLGVEYPAAEVCDPLDEFVAVEPHTDGDLREDRLPKLGATLEGHGQEDFIDELSDHSGLGLFHL